MIDLLKKGIYTGVGLGLMAKEKVEEIAKQAASEATMSEEEGKKFVDSLLNQSEEAKTNLEQKIKDTITDLLARMNLPTQSEVTELKERIEKLEQELKDNC